MIKTRIELAKEFARRGYKNGAEIGVADGRFSKIMCETIPNLHLKCIDPWKPYEGSWRGNDYQENAYNQAVEKLRPYNSEIIRATSLEASLWVEQESLDFVFIDGSHVFNEVMLDILLWTPKVRYGGIVAGHDYYHFHDSGVVEAINAYTQFHKINLNHTLLNDSEHKDDQVPSWWFEKSKKRK